MHVFFVFSCIPLPEGYCKNEVQICTYSKNGPVCKFTVFLNDLKYKGDTAGADIRYRSSVQIKVDESMRMGW